jgi:hypothetical protein
MCFDSSQRVDGWHGLLLLVRQLTRALSVQADRDMPARKAAQMRCDTHNKSWGK